MKLIKHVTKLLKTCQIKLKNNSDYDDTEQLITMIYLQYISFLNVDLIHYLFLVGNETFASPY